jgi:hypothetical protein
MSGARAYPLTLANVGDGNASAKPDLPVCILHHAGEKLECGWENSLAAHHLGNAVLGNVEDKERVSGNVR